MKDPLGVTSVGIEARFAAYLSLTKDPTAAAVLCLAQAVDGFRLDVGGSVGHEICLGIRHGLFGAGAPCGEALSDHTDDGVSTAVALDGISHSISCAVDTVERLVEGSLEKLQPRRAR